MKNQEYVTLTTTFTRANEEKPRPKQKGMIKFYLSCIKWLWKNRKWKNTRQKFKAMLRDNQI